VKGSKNQGKEKSGPQKNIMLLQLNFWLFQKISNSIEKDSECGIAFGLVGRTTPAAHTDNEVGNRH
jgi:hypothetical protein